MAATNRSTSSPQSDSPQVVSASAAAAAPSSMASAAFLSKDRLLSEAIPSSDDTTSFLDSLAESLEAVEAAHARPADPPLRSRPQDIVQSCMRGDAAALLGSSWFEQDSKQRVIRVFLSSTFTDTVHERAVLLRCVHPAVQRYARKLNFEVVFSEMRFGIRKSLSDDNKTSEVCMAELERCFDESASMAYMLFVRNKYGFRPPPRKVPRVDMDAMLALMPPADQDVILEFYELDENEVVTPQECYRTSVNMHGAANVAAAAYVQRNSSLISNYWPRFAELQAVLRRAASLLWPAALNELADYRSQHPIRFFFFSVTEEEICRGLFWKEAADVERSAHVFLRPIQAAGGCDLSSLDPNSKELPKYVDTADNIVDVSAQDRLSTLRDMIEQAASHAPAIVSKSNSVVEWLDGTGFHPKYAPHAIDLQKFAYDATVCLLESLDRANERLAIQSHPLMTEILYHMKFARVRCSKFAHSKETEHVTTKLRDYLSSSSGPGHAFVIYAASGSGKTYLMAEAADREANTLSSPADAVVVRFLGTSPASSSLADLLSSLCKQLHAISSDAAALPSSDDVEQLKEYFEHAMKTWQTGRLTVFLDSLDQLDDTGGGRKLRWLPTHGISSNVRLVVSTLPDEAAPADGKPFACLSILRKRYSGSPSDIAMAEVQPVDDVRSLLLHLLELRHHKLTDAQLRVLDAAIKLSPRTQTPLVVTILAVRFSEWPSHRDLPPDNRNPDGSLFVDTTSVRALVVQEFKALEAKHGRELVRATLSFITLAKDGVSETELSEILSLDDDVLASVYEWWVPPVRTLPTNPLTMLLADLKPYLTMRGAASGGGGLMMRWYHRQFWEAAVVYFLHDADERRRRHAQLGEFFSGAWAGRSKPYNDRLKAAVQKKVADEVSGNRQVHPQPLCLREGKSIFATKGDASAVNERRCREVAHHWLAAGMLCEAAEELCSFEGICARARCGEGFVLQQQLLHLCARIKELINQLDPQAKRAINQLVRVEHYARWLQRDMSTIIADPEAELSRTCSLQPDLSLVREEMRLYCRSTSAGVRFDNGSSFRSFVLSPINQNFGHSRMELKYHKKYVNCVAYNFDSSLLASASLDGTVVIWDAKTGMIECVFKGHAAKILSVAWSQSRDNRQLLVAGCNDNTVRLWDVSSQREVAVLTGHTGCVNSVAFDGSGKMLASGSDDKTVRLWDVSSQREVTVLTGHTRSVKSVAFDGSGAYLASGSGDNTVRLWDVSSQREVAVLTGHTECVNSVAFDGSGAYLASGSGDNTVRLWNISLRQEIAVLKQKLSDHATVHSVALDGCGKYVAACVDKAVRLWDVSSQREVAVLSGHAKYVMSVAFDISGKYLASGSFDNTVRLWDVSSLREVAVLKGHLSAILSVTCDGSGKHVASGSSDKTVRLWDVSSMLEVAVFKGHTDDVYSVAFDGIGKYLASGSADGTVRLWDVSSQREVAVLRGHTFPVISVALDCSGKYLAYGGYNSTLHLWDVSSQREVAVLTGHRYCITSVAFDGSGKMLVSGSSDKTVRLWDVSSQREVAVLTGHTGHVKSVAFDGSGAYLASGSGDKTVRLWDVSSQREVAVLTGHTECVNSVAFDGSGAYLASGSDDKTVRLWDVSSQREVAAYTGDMLPILSVAFDRSGAYLVSGSGDRQFSRGTCHNTLRLWDAHTQTAVADLTHHNTPTTSVHFSPSSALIAFASSDTSLRLWCATSDVYVTLRTRYTSTTACCIAWSSNEALLAAGACNGSVDVWETATGLVHATLQCPQAAAVAAIIVSPGGRLLAAAVGGAPPCVNVFDLASSSLLVSFALRSAAEQLRWSSDGQALTDDQGVMWNTT